MMLGTRVTRIDTGRTYEIVRITPAGSAGTSHADGPTFHAAPVGADGNVIRGGFVADIWSKSMSHPTAAYREV